MTNGRNEGPTPAPAKRRTGRRQFLAIGGGAILAAAAGGVVLAASTEGTPLAEWARCDCSAKSGDLPSAPPKETKMSKVLVAYASRCGSTGEIAAAIGEELCAAGADVVVKPVGEVSGLDGFDALVLGSATRMGKLLPEATAFLKKNTGSPAMCSIPQRWYR